MAGDPLPSTGAVQPKALRRVRLHGSSTKAAARCVADLGCASMVRVGVGERAEGRQEGRAEHINEQGIAPPDSAATHSILCGPSAGAETDVHCRGGFWRVYLWMKLDGVHASEQRWRQRLVEEERQRAAARAEHGDSHATGDPTAHGSHVHGQCQSLHHARRTTDGAMTP